MTLFFALTYLIKTLSMTINESIDKSISNASHFIWYNNHLTQCIINPYVPRISSKLRNRGQLHFIITPDTKKGEVLSNTQLVLYRKSSALVHIPELCFLSVRQTRLRGELGKGMQHTFIVTDPLSQFCMILC